jgi:energy-coupling factor transporter ATP-binding protein EcfA2
MAADDLMAVQNAYQTFENFELSPPYPGLRPFQPDDSEYFFGRDKPASEIVQRLRTERFVAVIGGSGSGKSSLVLAGAIPRLRSFAILEVGDFWVPILSTPGTNPISNDTPLRRLAQKFCSQLSAPVGENFAERLNSCVGLLRQPGGFGKLIDRYGNDVRDLDGVDPQNLKVNYLFLIDQFEEVFHRSNNTKEVLQDCCHLIDRIVEHSKNEQRHKQVCVALTMRSEHLNDCPRYQDLPDAINRAFYLVRRLDASQIIQAIQQPALRYLRKCIAMERQFIREAQRDENSHIKGIEWPETLVFEKALLSRLQRDAQRVLDEQDHADHLPLLQHLLFWLWDAACKRCKDAYIPDNINYDDLNYAIFGDDGNNQTQLSDETNVLRACLENHCESIYKKNEEHQSEWTLIFRSLAFKDPNTGTYTQRRASMPILSDQLGLSKDNYYSELRKLLGPWDVPHSYLHWDVESSTVKVGHETLIRRWYRLRAWIDKEDRQFQMYMRLLDECREWMECNEQERSSHLASGNALLIYENADLVKAIDDPARQQNLQNLLEMDREGERLKVYAPKVKDFLMASLQNRESLKRKEADNLEQVEKAERDALINIEKNRRQKLIVCIVLVITIGLTIISFALDEVSQKERMTHRGYALASETQANIRPQIGDYDQQQFALRSSIQAADLFVAGYTQNTPIATILSSIPGNWFVQRLKALRHAELLTEARTIGNLRNTLVITPWILGGGEQDFKKPSVFDCSTSQLGYSGIKEAKYFPLPDQGNKFGLIVIDSESRGITIHSPSTRGSDGKCEVGDIIFTAPKDSGVRGLGIDASVKNVMLSFDKYTQYYVFNNNSATPHLDPRAVVYIGNSNTGIYGLNSVRSKFASDIQIGEKIIRLFDVQPGIMENATASTGSPLNLVKKNEKSVCSAFASNKDIEKNERIFGIDPLLTESSEMGSRAVCIVVSEKTSENRTDYVGEIFVFSNITAAEDRVNRLGILENISFGSHLPSEMRLNRSEGWIAFRSSSNEPWRATAWTINAWRSEGKQVYNPEVVKSYSLEKIPELRRPYDLIMSDVEASGPNAQLKTSSIAK